MLSFLLPQNVNVFSLPGYIKMEGPTGSFIKKAGPFSFNTVSTSEGTRLFVTGGSFAANSTALSHLFRHALGLSRGFRRRLRLVGIGFRATRRDSLGNAQSFPIYTKNYMRKRRLSSMTSTNSSKNQLLNLKIGYSHESTYPLAAIQNRNVKASRLDGRSKGTLISLQSNNLEQLNQVAAEIRSFRLPDIYKGKGIYFDREVIKLKKGKRQG